MIVYYISFKRCFHMVVKSYYQQLKEDFKILDFVTCYQSDFTYHDRTELRTIKNFILAARETGTNIVDLDDLSNRCLHKRTLDVVQSCDAEDDGSYTFVFSEYNKRFFYGSGGIVKEINREESIAIFKKYLSKANAAVKIDQPKQLFPRVKAIIERVIQNYSGRWGGDMYEIFNFGNEQSEEGIIWMTKRDQMVKDITNVYLKNKFGKSINSLFTIDQQKEIYNTIEKTDEINKAFGPVLDKIRENRAVYWKPAIEKAKRIKPLKDRPGYLKK